MSKGGGTSTQTTTQTLDPQIKALLMGNYQHAQGVANTPFSPFTGEMVADFNPTQTLGQGMLTSLGKSNIGDPALNSAIGSATSASTFAPQMTTAGTLPGTDLTAYENPYQSDVIDATMKQLGLARDTGIMSDNQRATAAGAFGGDRGAVLNSLTNKDYLDTAASTVANLNAQNFTQAQNAATSDLNRQLTAAQGNQAASIQGANLNLGGASLLGDLSDKQIQDALTKAGLVSGVGDQQQQNQQQKDDAAYQEFLRKIGYPAQQQQLLNQSLGLLPNLTNETKTGTQPGDGGLGTMGLIGNLALATATF